MITLTF